jgi:hypothetical protein
MGRARPTYHEDDVSARPQLQETREHKRIARERVSAA